MKDAKGIELEVGDEQIGKRAPRTGAAGHGRGA